MLLSYSFNTRPAGHRKTSSRGLEALLGFLGTGGVSLHPGARVVEVDEGEVVLEGGERVRDDAVLVSPGCTVRAERALPHR
jgi:hypothetical protein